MRFSNKKVRMKYGGQLLEQFLVQYNDYDSMTEHLIFQA